MYRAQDLIFVAITLLISLYFSLSESYTGIMTYTITPSHSFSPSVSIWLSLAWPSILWFVIRPWQYHTPPVAFHIAKTRRALSQSQTMCLNSITRMGDGLGNWYVFQVNPSVYLVTLDLSLGLFYLVSEHMLYVESFHYCTNRGGLLLLFTVYTFSPFFFQEFMM